MIGNTEFQKIRRELSGNDPLVKRIKLKQLEITDESLKKGIILIKGYEVPVSAGFFHRLGNVVGINISLLKKMSKKNDDEVLQKLLSAIKKYSETIDGDKEFLLVGSSAEHKVVNIVRADKYSRLTNETLFKTAEVLLNEIPELSIDTIDNSNSSMSINIVHSQDNGFERLGPDEIFRFGISLVNTASLSQVKDFLYRMSCANGMLSKDNGFNGNDGTRGSLPGSKIIGPNGFSNIIQKAHGWSQTGFVPPSFEDRLHRAMDTQASYAELSHAYETVKNQIQEEDPDRKLLLEQALRNQMFPHLRETERRLINKGYDPLKLLPVEREFIRTGRTIWDTINDLTWLGSNKSTFELKDANHFKVEGGNLFTKKKWDLAYASLASI